MGNLWKRKYVIHLELSPIGILTLLYDLVTTEYILNYNTIKHKYNVFSITEVIVKYIVKWKFLTCTVFICYRTLLWIKWKPTKSTKSNVELPEDFYIYMHRAVIQLPYFPQSRLYCTNYIIIFIMNSIAIYHNTKIGMHIFNLSYRIIQYLRRRYQQLNVS